MDLPGSFEYALLDCDHLRPALVVDGAALAMLPFLVNGKPAFGTGLTGDPFAFLSADGTYVLHTALQEPRAYELSDVGGWMGDGWWRLDSLDLSDISANPTLVAQGLFQNAADAPASAPTVHWSWPRWVRDATESGSSVEPFGVYAAVDGATPARRTFGSMRFSSSNQRATGYWIESLDGRSFAAQRGGLVLSEDASSGLWVTGGYSAREPGAWYQSASAPARVDGATLVPMVRTERNAAAEVDRSAEKIVLTFDRYVSSGETGVCYMAEVALWR